MVHGMSFHNEVCVNVTESLISRIRNTCYVAMEKKIFHLALLSFWTLSITQHETGSVLLLHV